MTRRLLLSAYLLCTLFVLSKGLLAQGTDPATKPAEHFVGTVTAVDAANQVVTLKEDRTGAERPVRLQNTRTLLKVSPGAKDLKAAVRITVSDLAVGDRVDVRGSKTESDPNAVEARSVVLMSSRELQQAHQNEASAWQRSTSGTVSAVDPASKKLTVMIRSAEGPKPLTVDASAATFTRYSPEHPKSATPSQLSDVQTGDQVKIIGEKSADGSSVAAQKIYSGTFKTIAATVSSIAADGKSMVVKDLSSKQSVTVALGDDSGIHKLPPMMATMLARRFNPDFKGTDATGAPGSSQAGGPPAGAGRPADAGQTPGGMPSQQSGPGGAPRGGRMANGDLSQVLERLPKITPADLKTGDAVVVSGSPSTDARSTLLATSVIAGVEPIFQAAPGRQAQSLGDWGSSLGGGAAMDAGAPPQ